MPLTDKNSNINKCKINIDLSNNDILDLSNVKYSLNPLFFPFHGCKKEKNTSSPFLFTSNISDPQKKLNTTGDCFSMRFNSLLKKIQEERITGTKNDSKLPDIITTLDGLSHNKKIIGISKEDINPKERLDLLLEQICNKYSIPHKKQDNQKLLTDVPPQKTFLDKYKDNNPFASSIFEPFNVRNGAPVARRPPPPPPPPPLLPLVFLPRIIPPPPPLPRIIQKITIDREINSLEDILTLITDYPLAFDIEYNINMCAVHKIHKPLLELHSMIGMNSLKNNIVDQVIYFMQDLHIVKDNNQDFMHTVIYGPPGTGKTEIAKIIGKIFCNMGLLKRNIFKKATRSDLIAGYLGQTAIKTNELMKSCLGGVLFIDEAYALGNSEKRDSFAKECIDTLCEGLSDNKNNLMVIIAGYEEELNDCFFAYNQGLQSRFPWRFKTDDYDAHDLNLIFQKKVTDAGWILKDAVKDQWFEKNIEYFKYFGRDMETLFAKTKIAHSRRVFCKSADIKKKITTEDLKKGLAMFLDNEEVKRRKDATLNDSARLMFM